MDTYRRGRLEGRYDDGYGGVFLVVGGWGVLICRLAYALRSGSGS